MKELMLGNEAVARGLYEAGCRVVSSYPGTPSTEITEYAALYDEIYAEWAPNEKVALETALGAAVAGARSFCGMKHVGLNVAADPLFTSSYTGIGAGLIICVADDPGMHSSQNEQDSRHYAVAAKLPILEPSDSAECLEYVKLAYEISEKYDTPVILRLTTRVSHSRGIVEPSSRVERDIVRYRKDISKYVMMPSFAKARHEFVEKRMTDISVLANGLSCNRAEYGSSKTGIITSGMSYMYAKQVMPDASYLKLGMVNPLPEKLILDFASHCDEILVIEELDPIIENYCKSLGVRVTGKDIFPVTGEYSQQILEKCIFHSEKPAADYPESVPVRPPVLCPGCPHRGAFFALNSIGVNVCGDIGCYTLGAYDPLSQIDTTVCMGASVSMMHGFALADEKYSKNTVAVIGDSTFIHSGITGLINMTYNRIPSTLVILDNSTTGMTGHQDHPATGITLKGKETPALIIEDLCEAAGVRKERIRIVDPQNISAMKKAVSEELAADDVSVIIARSPCALLKGYVPKPAMTISQDKCRGCKSCFRIGCPAIAMNSQDKAEIDPTLCVGCGLCSQLCGFKAIEGGMIDE